MKTITIIFCSCLVAAAMQAQILHVPADYPSIQQGIVAANPGDTVLVADGTYYEQINFLGKKPLVVASEFITDGDESHIASTIIDGSQIDDDDTTSVVLFISGEDSTSVLYGFTITGGRGTRDYLPSLVGGGIYARNSGLCLRHNIITGNSVNDENFPDVVGVDGGAVFVDNDVDAWSVIEDNEILYNSVTTSNPECGGGGIFVIGNVRIENNIIRGNANHQLSAEAEHNNYGGGLCCNCYPDSMHEAVIRNNLIEDNTLEGVNGQGAGGICYWNVLTCSGNTFKGNSLNGPLPQEYGGGGLLLVEVEAISLVDANLFLSNESISHGGGLLILNCQAMVQNNVFSGNQAEVAGGGLFMQNIDLIVDHLAILVNNTFNANDANYGGAVYSYNASPLIFNCIFWQDDAFTGDEVMTSSGTAEIAWSNIDENKIAGPWIQGDGIMNEDPLFYDTTYLEPRCESPCIDQGVLDYTCLHGGNYETPGYDINDSIRPLGYGVDLGAYESCVGVGIEDLLAVGSSQLTVEVYPNPCSDMSHFTFRISQDQHVTLKIYDIHGREMATVVDGKLPAGEHAVQYDASGLLTGVYLYRLTANGQRSTAGKLVKY